MSEVQVGKRKNDPDKENQCENTPKVCKSSTNEVEMFLMNSMDFGTCEVEDMKKVILTVGCREINVGDITEEDIAWLDGHLEVAYYSDNNVKTTDVTVRNSKHTKAFNLNIDVSKIVGKGYVKPYKLNLYKKGSFFKTHHDTHRPGLLGTLVLILPTKYSGGELCFGNEKPFNVEEYLRQEMNATGKICFVYFDNEVKHSVSEVLNGNRISLVYNVFQDSASANYHSDPEIKRGTPQAWVDDMINYAAVSFCTGKKNILMGYSSYRNNASYAVHEALKSKFKVVKVFVEYDPKENISQSIKEVKIVQEIEHSDDDDDDNDNDNDDDDDRDYCLPFEDRKKKTYFVEHYLFSPPTILLPHTFNYSYGGNSPCSFHEETECLTGYLINPCER